MKRLYNIGTEPVVAGGWHTPAVFPGEAAEFTDKHAAALLASEPGWWSEANPASPSAPVKHEGTGTTRPTEKQSSKESS